MLSHSHLPISYWSYTISTTTHIINRLPTPILNNMSPWEVLYKSKPDIKHLSIFGCTCFPLLQPYNSHKLQPYTKPCLFLGYPTYSKGYICLDSTTHRIYITRHVLFNEFEFLFHENSPFSSGSFSSSLWHSSHTCRSSPTSHPTHPSSITSTQSCTHPTPDSTLLLPQIHQSQVPLPTPTPTPISFVDPPSQPHASPSTSESTPTNTSNPHLHIHLIPHLHLYLQFQPTLIL